MRTRTILSLSILSVALIASGCSRNRAASSAPIPKSASAAANDAAANEAAKLAEEAERAAAAERLAAERAAGERELVKAAIPFSLKLMDAIDASASSMARSYALRSAEPFWVPELA